MSEFETIVAAILTAKILAFVFGVFFRTMIERITNQKPKP